MTTANSFRVLPTSGREKRSLKATFQLMRIESDMLIEVITYLAQAGVTGLPLHDAVLVAQSKAEVAARAMQAPFERGAALRARSFR
ncbi:hypothetical protein XI03_07695 [Bradyrhizobium sp. CCBAU 65884]|nr:hypothetical protein [Bradyrhizobium sp. CCBAU 65884]